MNDIVRFSIWGLGMTILSIGSLAPAAEPISAAEALQKIRQAVDFDALKHQSGDLLAEGTVDHLGMKGEFRILFSPSGEFLQTIEAHGTHNIGFDGKATWERAFSRPTKLLDFGAAEAQQAFIAIRTHHWLAPESPYQVTLATEQKDGELALQISKPGDLIPTRVAVDRTSWLPIRASRLWLFGEAEWRFSDYAEFLGTKWPRISRFREGQALDVYDLKTIRAVPREERESFSPDSEVAGVIWDMKTPTRVELKRAPSGHLFVKGKVNGEDVGWFAFDTGTGGNVSLSKKVAERLHLETFGKSFAGGAGKQSATQFRQTESIQVGPATLKHAVCYELPEKFSDSMEKMFGFEWAGTIGYDFISQVAVEIDLSVPSLDIHNPAKFELKRGEWQPIRLNHGIPCLQCKVENQFEGWFNFDTGAGQVAIIHTPSVDKHQLLKDRKTQSYPLPGVGGTIDAQVGRLKEFTVAKQTISNVLTFFVTGKEGALSDAYTMGTFGAGILGGDTVILDYSHRRAALIQPSK